jgi:NAD(P)-dependent dehydrogenase (short-subunit alcohol dehydrogenase family)
MGWLNRSRSSSRPPASPPTLSPPGLVDTPILANFTEERLANFRRAIPAGRIGKPEEIAEAALYFASDEAGYVTGQVLNMSGGSYI